MTRGRIGILVAVVVVAALAAWAWVVTTRGRESTDDAQVDSHVTPIAARVGGTVLRVGVVDNVQTHTGAVLVEIDPRDFQIAVDRARAELADAEAAAAAANVNVPITATTTTSGVASAQGDVEQAGATITEAEQGVEMAKARHQSAQARLREVEANATKASKDVDRLKMLLTKDEIPQQQFDAVAATAEAAHAAVDSARAQSREAELAIKTSESRLAATRIRLEQSGAALRAAQTAPQQVAATRARASSAEAQVKEKRAALAQAELNLEYATVKAPLSGIVSRKTVEVGQVIQPGQPLMTVIPLEQVWITANFKETQLADMRVGQRATVEVDAYGGREFTGRVESIAAATGSRFSLLPPENATGNFVKVVQRVPVKIVLDQAQDPDQLLRPGMSVTPTVYTK